METSSLPTKQVSSWKRVAIVCFFSGFGIATAAAVILGSVILYKSRPIPPKPWNASALVATESPYFRVDENGKKLVLRYVVRNNLNADYSQDEEAAKKLRALFKLAKQEALTPPLEHKGMDLEDTPIFIPAKEKGTLVLSIEIANLPTKQKNETDDDFNERLRTYLEKTFPNVSGFVLYDEVNRYQINLPKWPDKRSDN